MSAQQGRVVLFDGYGGPEVLYLAEQPVPVPGPGEVRVKVAVAGVQPFDLKRRRGELAKWMPDSFPARIGNEFCGVVDEVGPEVSGWRAGAPVLGSTPAAAYADYIVVPAANLVARPEELDPVLAGALVAAGQTASGALESLAVKPGDTLLVHAAAGSVGTVAVQLARELGATVVGTASVANHEYLRSLGAIPVTYGPGLPERVRAAVPGGVTVALDAIGGDAIPASIESGAPPGRVGTIVDQATAEKYGAISAMAPRSPERLGAVLALAVTGKLVMPVRTYPLTSVVSAHADLEKGHGRGKVVLLT